MSETSFSEKTMTEVFYIVERIEDIADSKNKHVRSKAGVTIFIKWEGYARNENTWEPIENLNLVNAVDMLEALYVNPKVNTNSRKRLLISKAIDYIKRRKKKLEKEEQRKKKKKKKRGRKPKNQRKKPKKERPVDDSQGDGKKLADLGEYWSEAPEEGRGTQNTRGGLGIGKRLVCPEDSEDEVSVRSNQAVTNQQRLDSFFQVKRGRTQRSTPKVCEEPEEQACEDEGQGENISLEWTPESMGNIPKKSKQLKQHESGRKKRREQSRKKKKIRKYKIKEQNSTRKKQRSRLKKKKSENIISNLINNSIIQEIGHSTGRRSNSGPVQKSGERRPEKPLVLESKGESVKAGAKMGKKLVLDGLEVVRENVSMELSKNSRKLSAEESDLISSSSNESMKDFNSNTYIGKNPEMLDGFGEKKTAKGKEFLIPKQPRPEQMENPLGDFSSLSIEKNPSPIIQGLLSQTVTKSTQNMAQLAGERPKNGPKKRRLGVLESSGKRNGEANLWANGAGAHRVKAKIELLSSSGAGEFGKFVIKKDKIEEFNTFVKSKLESNKDYLYTEKETCIENGSKRKDHLCTKRGLTQFANELTSREPKKVSTMNSIFNNASNTLEKLSQNQNPVKRRRCLEMEMGHQYVSIYKDPDSEDILLTKKYFLEVDSVLVHGFHIEQYEYEESGEISHKRPRVKIKRFIKTEVVTLKDELNRQFQSVCENKQMDADDRDYEGGQLMNFLKNLLLMKPDEDVGSEPELVSPNFSFKTMRGQK